MKEITVDGKTYLAVPEIAGCDGCIAHERGQDGWPPDCLLMPACGVRKLIFIKPEEVHKYIALKLTK